MHRVKNPELISPRPKKPLQEAQECSAFFRTLDRYPLRFFGICSLAGADCGGPEPCARTKRRRWRVGNHHKYRTRPSGAGTAFAL